jgi:hypothetical protein
MKRIFDQCQWMPRRRTVDGNQSPAMWLQTRNLIGSSYERAWRKTSARFSVSDFPMGVLAISSPYKKNGSASPRSSPVLVPETTCFSP